MLAHRLGLVPLQGDKDGLRWLRWFKRATEDDPQSDMPSDYNTIIMNLDVECTWQDGGMERYKKGETDPKKLYHNSSGESACYYTWVFQILVSALEGWRSPQAVRWSFIFTAIAYLDIKMYTFMYTN